MQISLELISLYDIKNKEQITVFLGTKIKSREEDPDKKWITTWNHYLNRIKLFFRWHDNIRGKDVSGESTLPSEWETRAFVRIKGKKTKRLSSYSETELWDRDEILLIVKYDTKIVT